MPKREDRQDWENKSGDLLKVLASQKPFEAAPRVDNGREFFTLL